MFRHFFMTGSLITTAFLLAPCLVGQKLSDQERAGFVQARTARIVVKQSYSQAPAVNLAFEKTLRGLIKYLGLKAVEDQQDADLTFEVDATGSALGRTYIGETKQGTAAKHLYTGASVSGTVNIRGPAGKGLSRGFNGAVEPRQMVFDTQTDQNTTPAGAPFDSAFIAGKSSYLYVLGQLVTEIYGPARVATAFVDEDSYVSGIGREALLQQDLQTAFSISIDAIVQNTPSSRKAGSIALTAITQKYPQSVDLLLAAASHKDPNVRIEVIYALTPVADPRTRDVMVQALSDPNRAIRLLGASRLEYNYDKRATEPLLIALRDRDPEIRWSAATALKGAGIRAIEPLMAALKDKDEHVRLAAHQSLKSVTRQQLGTDPKGWQQWWKANKPIYEKAEAQMQKYLEMERQRKKSNP